MTKSLVIYFSMTNNTKKVAEMIAQELGADTYRIQAKQPYTSEDLKSLIWVKKKSQPFLHQVGRLMTKHKK